MTRLQTLRTLNHSDKEALRQATLVLCEKDIVYWVNNFGWTFDPRLEISYIPMLLFPKQEEFLLFLEDCEKEQFDAIVEKSRDMGVTWLCCFFLVHRWLFKTGFKGAIGSRKEDLVDKSGDMDSIFEKMRMLIKRLPSWMIPPGFNERIHDKHLTLVNPSKESYITGEAGDNMGRGGRNGPYFVDEAAFVEHPDMVDSAISNNAGWRIYVSTPNGIGNPFASKRADAARDPDGPIKIFTFHWKDDPRKNHYVTTIAADGSIIVTFPWYEKLKKIIRNPIIIAQEVDIDYSASIEGITIPAKYVEAAVGFAEWLWQTEGLKLPNIGHEAGWDIAGEGDNLNVLSLKKGAIVYDVVTWDQMDTFLSTKKAVRECNQRRVEVMNFDAIGVGTAASGNLKSGGLNPNFVFRGIQGGQPASHDRWIDGINSDGSPRYKKAKDKFQNFRAEIWWQLRTRFEKTYEYKMLGILHPLEDLISIPNIPDLISQLSSVLHWTTTSGKIQIESKLDMRERGVSSPDYADSLVYTFVKRRKPKDMMKSSSGQEYYG